ncbi:MAG: DUF1311 domain-containing protein [Synergistaceae bacterium]|nr:DUF1311 domain-containing protein [Synergistaceae bacterium]
MKRILTVLALILVLSGSAFGLSDKEYLSMKRGDSDFAEADRVLTQVWKRIRDEITRPAESAFEILKEEQREWIASGRDKSARKYIKKGYSHTEAYTFATYDRVNELEEWEELMFGDEDN